MVNTARNPKARKAKASTAVRTGVIRIALGNVREFIHQSSPEYTNIIVPAVQAEMTSRTRGWVRPARRTMMPKATSPQTRPK